VTGGLRGVFAGLAAAWLAAFIPLCAAVAAQPSSKGVLAPSSPAIVNLGAFPDVESRSARFTLANTGEEPVEVISVSHSCGCADPEVSLRQVEPGETTEITLRTLAGTLKGPFSKSFYVLTSSVDPDARVIQLTIAGRGEPAAPGAEAADAAEGAVEVPDAAVPAPEGQAAPLAVEFFVQEGCAECKLLRGRFIPAAEERYGGRVGITVLDTHKREIFLRLLAVLEAHSVKENEPIYMVLAGREVIPGWDAIRRRGIASIDALLASPPQEALPPPAEAPLGGNAAERLARRFTVGATALAGLADGLNPCAFTTIVFLTSLLALGGRSGRAVLAGGLSFCLASFVTYFLIGLGLLYSLRQADGVGWLREAIGWGTVAVLLVFAALSLLDAWRYRRTGDPGSVLLQLPAPVKRRIREFAVKRWGGPAVFGAGFLCGAGVTVLESVCTGQLYLPTLVMVSREGGGARVWGLLALYNVMFIVPLFAVFLLAASGFRSQRLAELSRRHVVPSKVLLAAVFLALAALLVLQRHGTGG